MTVSAFSKRYFLSSLLASCLFSFSLQSVQATTLTFNDLHTVFPGQKSSVSTTVDSLGQQGSTRPEEMQIRGMKVEVDENNYLQRVILEETSQSFFVGYDSLFINTSWDGTTPSEDGSGSNWQSWDYLVHSRVHDGINFVLDDKYHYNNANDSDAQSLANNAPWWDGLYTVKDEDDYHYTYTADTYSTPGVSGGRTGHANGIDLSDLRKVDDMKRTFDFSGTSGFYLIWDFTGLAQKIELDKNFVIGFTPWCSNDVMLALHKDSTPVDPVPEPATMLLFGLGLLGMGHVFKRKNPCRAES